MPNSILSGGCLNTAPHGRLPRCIGFSSVSLAWLERLLSTEGRLGAVTLRGPGGEGQVPAAHGQQGASTLPAASSVGSKVFWSRRVFLEPAQQLNSSTEQQKKPSPKT